MEGVEVKEKNSGKRRSMDSAEDPSEVEIAPRRTSCRLSSGGASQEVSSVVQNSLGKAFNLEHEATRQGEIAEFMRRNVSSITDVKSFAESTMRLLSQIYSVADARGERLDVQIPSLEVVCITTLKNQIDVIIGDVEEVKMKCLGRKKVTTQAPSVTSVMARGKVHDGKNWDYVVHKVKDEIQEHAQKAQRLEAEEIEQERFVMRQEDATGRDVMMTEVSCCQRQLGVEKSRSGKKRTRIMCQPCLDKPRNSVILGCKHSMYCNQCLNAGDKEINNCPGCGVEITDIVFCRPT